MNNLISSKLSLYDILAMVIPGTLILYWSNVVIFENKTFIADPDLMDGWAFGILFITSSYLIGIIYSKLVECLCSYLNFRNNEDEIFKSLKKVNFNISKYKGVNETKIPEDIKNRIIDDYYRAYAYVQKNRYRNAIDILETQVAFLRSMVPILVIIILTIQYPQNMMEIVEKLVGEGKNGYLASLLVIIAVLTIYTILKIQKKIYEIVWEDYHYLQELRK